MGKEVASLYATIGADTSGLQTGLSNAEKSMLGVRSTIGNLDKDINLFGKNLGSISGGMQALGISLPITPMAALGQGIKFAAERAQQAIQTTMKYSEEVRKLGLFTGNSAQETSRLVQVADDLKIEYSTLTVAARTMINNGIQPSVEALAKLSDQYLSLRSPVERSAFLLKSFGKSGIEMGEAMNRGGDAIRKMGQAVSGSLLLTDEQTQASEDLRAAQDELNDTFMAMSVSLGTELIPYLISGTEAMIDFVNIMGSGVKVGLDIVTMLQSINIASKDTNKSILASSTSYDGYIASIQEMNRNMSPLAPLMEWITEEAYNQKKAISDISGEYDTWVGVARQVKPTLDQIATAEGSVISQTDKMKAATQQWVDTTPQKYMEGWRGSIVDAGNAMGGLNASLGTVNESFKQLTIEMFYNKAAATMDGEGALWLARQMGLLNEDTYAVLSSIDDLTAKYDTNGQAGLQASEMTAEYKRELMALNAEMDRAHSKTITFTMITKGIQYGESTSPTAYGKTEARAEGGPVNMGQSYWVGERGPELFTPGASGAITPNGMGGGKQINIYVSGNTILGDDRTVAKELARIIQPELNGMIGIAA